MQEDGRVGEAVRSYQGALAKDPYHSPAALALGTLLAQPGPNQQPSLAEVCLFPFSSRSCGHLEAGPSTPTKVRCIHVSDTDQIMGVVC